MSVDDGPGCIRLFASAGRLDPVGFGSERRLSELVSLFGDQELAGFMASQHDAVVYSGSTAPIPLRQGEMGLATTRIEPGRVGEEFFMTHGHTHELFEGEAYIGMAGRGGLLLRRGRELAWVEMRGGTAGRIPPGWAHRTINVGQEPFTFLAVYPRLSGHDYSLVAAEGMGARVQRAGSGYRVVRDDGVVIAAGR